MQVSRERLQQIGVQIKEHVKRAGDVLRCTFCAEQAKWDAMKRHLAANHMMQEGNSIGFILAPKTAPILDRKPARSPTSNFGHFGLLLGNFLQVQLCS